MPRQFTSPVLVVAAVLLALSAGCETQEVVTDAPRFAIEHYNLSDDGPVIGGYSPVSYFEAGRAERGSSEFAVTHEGIIYWMNSAEQVTKFKADPQKYEPTFGGWCAYGMAKNKKFSVDPTSFKIVDGKLYLFHKDNEVDALKLWNQEDRVENAWKAARNWNEFKVN